MMMDQVYLNVQYRGQQNSIAPHSSMLLVIPIEVGRFQKTFSKKIERLTFLR